MKITVFGLWHLGCVTAAGLAELGYNVVGTDFEEESLKDLSQGRPPIFEPGLGNIIKKHLRRKSLKFLFDKKAALEKVDFIFLTFDTKVGENDRIDLRDINRASVEISKYIKDDAILVVSSQLPVGTSTKIKEMISKKNKKCDVCYVPENLRLGEAINSFLKPDRIVIGANKDVTLKKVKKLFEPLKCEQIFMSVESAEMAKHALNAYLAACISFINEISDICELTGASAVEVVKALKTDKRVSPYAPINPGLGFSGGTLARDVQVLRKRGKMRDYDTKILDAVIQVNNNRVHLVSKKLEKLFGSLRSLKVGILGLTYKPGTDTLRRSISLEIAKDIISRGATVKAYDPKIREVISNVPEIEVCRNAEDVARGSDVIVLVTEWPEFKKLQLGKIKTLMKNHVFLDTKNFLDPQEFRRLKFRYIGVGYET